MLDEAIEQALALALSQQVSVRIGGDDRAAAEMAVVESAGLRRRDGASVYCTAHSQLYTTAAVLDAERTILAAAAWTDGRRVPVGLVELALLEARAAGRPLNPGQQTLVTELATSGRRVQVALAPAGARSGHAGAVGRWQGAQRRAETTRTC